MTPETLLLDRHDWVPNNPDLPVLHYRKALQRIGASGPDDVEAVLGRTGWPARWHSTAHEVLVVIAGRARVILGGPGGCKVEFEKGDLVVLPAGMGHCLIEADAEFQAIGAYPAGQDWDLCRDAPDDATLQRISEVPFPASDPLEGPDGALPRLWRRA